MQLEKKKLLEDFCKNDETITPYIQRRFIIEDIDILLKVLKATSIEEIKMKLHCLKRYIDLHETDKLSNRLKSQIRIRLNIPPGSLTLDHLNAWKDIISRQRATRHQEIQSIQNGNLPNYLEKVIFDDLKGQYYPDFEGAKKNLNNTPEEDKQYLGTYFPRSYIETFNIMTELLKSKNLRESLENRSELRILDIGSGNGGSSLGILEALLRHDLLDYKTVVVYSVDGNNHALESQQRIFEAFASKFKVSMVLRQIETEIYRVNFTEDLKKAEEYYDGVFDTIITSKFLSEFYHTENNKTLYSDYLSCIQKYLHPEGLIILSDVTIRSERGYIPKIMNKEIKEYIKNKKIPTIRYILPSSCAWWSDECSDYDRCFMSKPFRVSHKKAEEDRNVTFHVLATQQLAKKILDEVKKKEQYSCNYSEACRAGKLIPNQGPAGTARTIDGFLLHIKV